MTPTGTKLPNSIPKSYIEDRLVLEVDALELADAAEVVPAILKYPKSDVYKIIHKKN